MCALPTDHVEDALDYLGCQADVVSLDPHSLDDVLATFVSVGERAGVRPRAEAVVAEARERLAAVAAAVHGRPAPKVAMVEWVDPPFTAGHWVPDLVTAGGGRPVAARPGEKSVATTWDAIRAAQPDVVVVSPCGSPESPPAPSHPVWLQIATKINHTRGEATFERPTSRRRSFHGRRPARRSAGSGRTPRAAPRA